MSDQRATYGCTALLGTNKTGALKPDADGYYTLVLGGFDVYNSAGAYYPLKPAQRLFEQSSGLMRRIAGGNCRAECGHPKKTPGMTMREFLERIMIIDEDKVCAHIAEVTLDAGSVKDKTGRPVVSVIGKVKPSGPKGEALRESLENPKENVCFSVRSLTDDRVEAGVLTKHVRSIITWDYVNEPGIEFAKKWATPALESFDEMSFTQGHFDAVRENLGSGAGVGMESHGVDIGLEGIYSDFGWTQDKRSGLVLPPSASW